MEATEVLLTKPANAMIALSSEMSFTPTMQLQHQLQQQQQQTTPLSPLEITCTTQAITNTPITPRTTTHTPREMPTMYILDQMYDDYMDQYNGNNITTSKELPETNASLKLAPCSICSRTFNPVTLKKHESICEKMATKKRNKFDSSRQRREGTELASYPLPKNFGLPEKTTSTTAVTAARHERGQSPKPPVVQQVSSPVMTRKKPTEDLIRTTARASMRKAVAASKSPTPAANVSNSTPTSNLNRDRMRSSDRSLTRRGIQPPPAEQCPHCERCFGIKAYDRHVEWCKEKALLASIKQGNAKNDGNVAKARLEARTKYRAPCLKTKRSLNREKYAGLAGEEQEIEDEPKASPNKTQENSIMSMSMTSSVCSERKITNSTTGNINEPVATAKVHNKNNVALGNHKYNRDKSQSRQQPPTIRAAATTTTKTITTQEMEDNEEEASNINLEFEMQELYLMGEQMTATNSINKKRRTRTTTKSKVDTMTSAKIKQQQQQQQQQQQLTDIEQNLEINSDSYQKWKTMEAQLNLSPSQTSLTFEQQKSASDLSLKSMRRQKTKAFRIDNDMHEDHNYHNDNNVSSHDEMKFEANEMPIVENHELTNCLTSYDTAKNNKKVNHQQQVANKAPLDNDSQQDYTNTKMTLEEYFNKEKPYDLDDNADYSTKFATFYSQDSNDSNDDDLNIVLNSKKFPSDKTKIHSGSTTARDFSPIDPSDEQYQNLVMKQTCARNADELLNNDNDSEELIEDSEIRVFKLDIPNSPIKHLDANSNRRTCKTKIEQIESHKISKSRSLEMEEKISLTPKSNTTPKIRKPSPEESPETFKDCLTDSDELRRQNMASQESLNTQEQIREESKEREYKDAQMKNYEKTLRNSSKSDTFIRDLNEKSYKIFKAKDDDNVNYSQTTSARSSENGSCKKTKIRSSSLTKSKEKKNETFERNDTPRGSRITSSPPPQLPTTSTTNTSKTENNSRMKSLKMCQPQRKKVLRQTASSTNTFPMKATMLPLSIENLEICGVSSAPQMKTKNNNNDDDDISRTLAVEEEKIELKIEKCNDMEMVVDKKNTCVLDKDIKVIKEPPQLKRNRSFTVNGLPDNYDPFLSAKRQLEELCSPSSDSADIPTTPQTPKLPNMSATANSNNKMSTSLILSSPTSNTTSSLMTTSQLPQQTHKTPVLTRSSSFRRTSSLRGPRRSPLISTRPPLFAQKHRPTIQRGLSDEGPISTNFLKPEEYDEMPVRSVCVNDYALSKSPRVVRRDTSTSNRKQPLKLNINAANGNSSSCTVSPSVMEPETKNNNTASKYVSKTDSLAVFLKFEHELEKLNEAAADNQNKKESLLEVKEPHSNLDGPLNAKELKEKSNILSKQNSAKNIKADIMEANDCKDSSCSNKISTNDVDPGKYGHVRLAPLATKPATPSIKPNTPQQMQQPLTTTTQLMPLEGKNCAAQSQEQKILKSPKPVALSSLFASDNKNTKATSLLYAERQNTIDSDYIDPKLINKCDNLPINLNLKLTDFKHSDSDNSESRLQHFSSSSSESSTASAHKKTASQPQHAKFLPSVKQQQQQQTLPPQQQQQQQQREEHEQNNNLNLNQQLPHTVTHSQRNSAEGRNLLKRRMRLGRNQFLYDASPEGDSCSADDEGANRSSMEGDASQKYFNSLREREKHFERLNSAQINPIDAPFIPPLPAFDDFDFEEFLSSFENDEEQFPLFKDCREFLMNRTSKKQRSMLATTSATQNTNIHNNNNNNTMNFKKSTSPQTFPPLMPQSHAATAGQHFQFPTLSQHPKNLFNSFSLNNRARNKLDELSATKLMDTISINSQSDDYKDIDSSPGLNQKREIFISIETEQNDLDKSSISPNSIRNMVGNPQTVVEVEVDAAHDNKFSKISDDDTDANEQSICRSKKFVGQLAPEKLPNVQLNNAKNLRQKMHEDFHEMDEGEISDNIRLAMEHKTAPVDVNMNANTGMSRNMRNMTKINRSGTPSVDGYGDSDELSSLDGYPLSSPNSRLGVSSKTSADSAYGSLSRQRSTELASQRNSSRNRNITSNTANTLLNRPLTEETSLGRSRQLSASSSSSSEHALPPIASGSSSNSYNKQHLYKNNYNHNNNNSNNNNNNNNIANNLDDLMRYELHNNNNSSNNNNNYDNQITHSNLTGATNSHSNLESLQQYTTSNSTMSTSMKMSKFCHECGSKFLLEQAKFCMDCGVKRIVL